MASTLQDKRIVVIGGSSGIGFAVAQAALEAGAKVTVVSSQSDRVEAAVAKLGAGADGSALDVTDEAAVGAFFGKLRGFDHLAFTAGDWGAMAGGPITETDLAAAGAIFKVRFWGAVAAVKHAAGKIAPGGSITLTDGTIAHRPRKGAALSTAMAGAIEHLVQALAVDLAPVRVNAVCPALIRTEIWSGAPEGSLRRMTERQPLPRAGEPSEVAEAYLYLMKGGYTTGQVLKVDGGATLV